MIILNVNRIREQANLHAQLQIDKVYARRWINEAMRVLADLYDSANIRDTVRIDVTDVFVKYPLPNGCKKVKRVYFSKRKYESYEIDVDVIWFEDCGSFDLEYLKIPDDVTTDTETPSINEAYHIAISYFVGAKSVETIKPKRASELLSSFYIYADNANSSLNRIKRKRTIPVGAWR